MNCNELVELATAYLDGSLPADRRSAFVEHLDECSGCERYLEQFRLTIALLGELPDETLAAPARERLLAEFTDRSRRTDPEAP
jgi:anti-sigma factor RsiW